MDCIFCKIIAGQIPSDVIYTDDKVIAFRDINPMAPVHLLIIPREHIVSLNDITEQQTALMGHLVQVAKQLARQQGIATKGYRVVTLFPVGVPDQIAKAPPRKELSEIVIKDKFA